MRYLFIFLQNNFRNFLRLRTSFFYALFLGLLYLMVSCDDTSNCQLTDNRRVQINFIKKVGTVEKDTAVRLLTVTAIGSDSVFYNKTAKVSKISLELSQVADSSTFILNIDTASIDTLTFFYKKELTLVSTDCGFNTMFTLKDTLSYTKHSIESVEKINSSISVDVDKNIKIYLKTK